MIAAADNRTGRRIARLFRKARELPRDVRACDLDGILAQDEIDVQESFCDDPGYTACLLRMGAGIPPGIMVAAGQSRGRRRFSVAHELGHLYIPTHADRPAGWCSEAAMEAQEGTGDKQEWEANDFAAELLMPLHLFSSDAANFVPSFASVCGLAAADQYDVSVTAAAVRYVELTRHACALVSSRNGRIEWVTKSEPFVYRIPWIGDKVPAESVAARSHEPVAGPHLLDAHVWLEYAQRRCVELFESTHWVPSQQQILSLVWVVEDEEWE